jgi:hypothetical protein
VVFQPAVSSPQSAVSGRQSAVTGQQSVFSAQPQPAAVETLASRPLEFQASGPLPTVVSPIHAANGLSPVFDQGERHYARMLPQRSGAFKMLLRLMMFAAVSCGVVLALLFLKGWRQAHQPDEDRPEVASGSHSTHPASLTPAKHAEKGGKVQTLNSEGESGRAAAKPAGTAVTPIADVPSINQEPDSPSEENRPGSGTERESKEPETPPDPQKRQAMQQALENARAAMASRNLAAARKFMKLAADNVQTPADEAETGRVGTILDNLEEFWKGMDKIMGTLSVGQEFTIANTPMIVVSSAPGRLTIRTEGQNRSYDRSNLPRAMVVGLAVGGFAKHPSSKVLLGTYLAMDSLGNRAEAKRLWVEAADQGEDVKDLMPELDRAGPAPAVSPDGDSARTAPSEPAKAKKTRKSRGGSPK